MEMCDATNIGIIDTFVMTIWRHELHTARNMQGAINYNLRFQRITTQKVYFVYW